MSDDNGARIRMRRSGRLNVHDDEKVDEVGTGDSVELELVSTQMLKQILSSGDAGSRTAIEEAAGSDIDGVLARDIETGFFEIIDSNDLQAILDQNEGLPKFTRPSDPTVEPLRDYVESESLSLVSTQALKRVFNRDDPAAESEPDLEADNRGFNPYDCS